MSNRPHVLADQPVSTKYRLVSGVEDSALTQDDPAAELLKDFRRMNPLIAQSSEEIPELKKRLDISREAFCVVVNRSEEVIGILLLRDLIGSLPMSLASQRGSSIADIMAQDVMRPVWSLPTMGFSKLQDMTVGDLVSVFKKLHSDYLLITDTVAGSEESVIRGLLSADDLSRRLGIRLKPDPRPETFSDIVHAVRSASG